MAGETEADIPETGAVFTFGKSKFADNVPSKFWLKNGVPLKLACGDEHTALITENGKLFMFGSNNWGQLGLGEKISVNKPTCVKALKSEKVKLVACGRTHTLVYTSCGNLYTAGGNNEGQLGLGDFGERTSFQLVEFFTKHGPVKMIAAGSNTSAAITQDGKLYVWGDNSEGQIGLGEEEGTSTPRELDIGRQVTWISCGYYHSAFVTEDGALFSFGESDSGKLGLCISQFPNHRVPQQVEGICEPVLQVACGGGHTLVLTEKNLYTFGLGQFGQLGHGTFTFETLIPKEVEHFRKGKVKHIACGENHSAVLTESGLLYTFGDGRHGKLALGDEYFANQFKPTLCPRFLKYNVQAVTCGGCHMVVLAKPRLGSEVILEDNDVTEDHLEKLLREAESRHSLNRSLSARDRRRERERSPEQFGIMFQTLPRLNSGELDGSLPAPSQTLPSHLNNRTTNVFQRNSLPSSTGMLTEDHEVDGKTPVEIYRDNQSVKDLGETADLFNLTHAMKMDPAEKTITLSPVQKISDCNTVEFSDDETTGEEEQTEDDEDEEDLTHKNDVEQREHEENHELVGQTQPQESTVNQTTSQVKNDIEEATVPDGPNRDFEDEDTSSPLIEEKLNQNQAKQNRPKRLFGSNSKISLFKRRSSSTKKEQSKAPAEDSSPAEKASGSSGGDVKQGSSKKASNSRAVRSRSATCTLL